MSKSKICIENVFCIYSRTKSHFLTEVKLKLRLNKYISSKN